MKHIGDKPGDEKSNKEYFKCKTQMAKILKIMRCKTFNNKHKFIPQIKQPSQTNP